MKSPLPALLTFPGLPCFGTKEGRVLLDNPIPVPLPTILLGPSSNSGHRQNSHDWSSFSTEEGSFSGWGVGGLHLGRRTSQLWGVRDKVMRLRNLFSLSTLPGLLLGRNAGVKEVEGYIIFSTVDCQSGCPGAMWLPIPQSWGTQRWRTTCERGGAW